MSQKAVSASAQMERKEKRRITWSAETNADVQKGQNVGLGIVPKESEYPYPPEFALRTPF